MFAFSHMRKRWCWHRRANAKQQSTGLLHPVFKSLTQFQKETPSIRMGFYFWRSRRDLNPRYPFGVHTISSRARYDHFDTAPWMRLSCRLAYNTPTASICQALILHFLLRLSPNPNWQGADKTAPLLMRKLAPVKLCVESPLFQKFLMLPLFYNLPIPHHKNQICLLNG